MSTNENPVVKMNEAYLEYVAGKIDRRQFMARASALGVGAAVLNRVFSALPVSAQDASPVPSRMSITAAEFKQKLMEWWEGYTEPAKTGGTLIYGELASSNLTTYNLMLGADAPTNPVMNLVQETLVGTSPIDGSYVPNLADHWEIAEDGKTYTFYLRQGVMWHDGTPFTADDVTFSMDAQANTETGSSYQATFTGAVASWEKVDDTTVKVVAQDVFAEIIFHGNAYCPIIPKHIWESVPPASWATDGGANGTDPSRVVGTGPLKFKEVNEGEGTSTFIKNEGYYDQIPPFDTFIFSTWPDEVAVVEALRAGNIDFYEPIPPADVAGLQTPEQGTDVVLYDTYDFSWYGYNMDPEKTPLFQDVKVRQALLYALDRDSMVTNIMLGFAEVANGTQAILSPAYAPDRIRTKYTYDPEKAKQLLSDAGWTDSDGDGTVDKDGQKMSFQIMYGSGSATSDQIVAYIQEAWKAIGVDGQPNPVDFGAVLVPALTENFDYDVCLLGFQWDPTGDQSAMFATNSYKNSFNAMKYSNPEVDRLFAEAARELDSEKRVELLIEANNLINEDLPIACLWFRKNRVGVQTRIKNFSPNGNGGLLWSVPYVWIEE